MLYMDFVLRVALSMVLGFLIGLERQLTGHPHQCSDLHGHQLFYPVSHAVWL